VYGRSRREGLRSDLRFPSRSQEGRWVDPASSWQGTSPCGSRRYAAALAESGTASASKRRCQANAFFHLECAPFDPM
jgi:hypothetical protein